MNAKMLGSRLRSAKHDTCRQGCCSRWTWQWLRATRPHQVGTGTGQADVAEGGKDEMSATDLIVRTRNPQLLDETVQALPGPRAVVVDGSFNGDTCRVRVLGDPGFMRFAITNQGYGEVVGEEDAG